MADGNKFSPQWLVAPPQLGTYHSIFKWGDPNEFEHPNQNFYRLIKQSLNLTDKDFESPKKIKYELVKVEQSSRLSARQMIEINAIVGEENIKVDDYSRASHCYGKTMLDLLRLREGIIENPPDAVVHPRNEDDIRRLLIFCNKQNIPIVVFGGGSSVTQGVECTRGGISLDMRTHMNKILKIDPVNQTATVQPGIYGPDLEYALNKANVTSGTPYRYTCGHFPQSFEYSTVGGWVATRGAGQNSTYYGKIEDMVLSQKYLTPAGEIMTIDIPAKAIGPDVDQIMIGSEGAFGILVEITLKVFRYRPDTRKRFGFVFRDWHSSLEACREIMQGEFGFPSVFRLSDPEETDVAFKLYNVNGTLIDRFLRFFDYHPLRRCLLIGYTDGEHEFGKLVHRKVKQICKKFGATYATGYVTKRWERNRFKDPYLRDSLGDFGIIIDTLECGVNWSNLNQVWDEVRTYCHSRPNMICMAHASHFYPQGTNLYFIFIAKMEDIEEYRNYQAGILDVIRKNGATMSHHHGIGKMIAPWLEGQIGKYQMDIFRALKQHFDPNNIMNPGGTLGIDLSPEENRPLP